MEVKTCPVSPTRFGVFELDRETGELRRSGIRIHLQEQPYRILLKLLEQPGKIVSHEELKTVLSPSAEYGDFDQMVRIGVWKLRNALNDEAQSPRYIETIPLRGYRFIADIADETPSRVDGPQPSKRRRRIALILTGSVMLGIALLLLRSHRATPLAEKPIVVVADVINHMQDPEFTAALRQRLQMRLGQSSSLTVLPEGRVRFILRQLGHDQRESITAEVAREICLRENAHLVVEGAILGLGTQYVLGLRAVSCSTGDVVAQEQEQVIRKEDLLRALDKQTSALVRKLARP